MFAVPILLITFNRPDHTRKVLSVIRKQQPRDLFISQDGPRNDGDVDKIKEVRSVINSLVDWPCHFHTLYQEKNLGCGLGPASAISWFFDNVENGIIIEDDCVPHDDFFEYCSILLHKYNDHEEIRAIGSMAYNPRKYGDGSYYFTMMNRNLCAWATWKRAWKDFNYYMSDVSTRELFLAMSSYGVNLRMKEFWVNILDLLHRDCEGLQSWDMQFLMSIWLHHGKGIFPNTPLSTNIGFDNNATHDANPNDILANVEALPILPLVHPSSEKIIKKSDLDHDRLSSEPYNYGLEGIRRLPYRLNRRIKRILGHEGSWIHKS